MVVRAYHKWLIIFPFSMFKERLTRLSQAVYWIQPHKYSLAFALLGIVCQEVICFRIFVFI